jgi:prefoldin subunit 5
MTGFMSDTLEKFREANEKYKTAKSTFVNLKNFSTGSKEKVEKMLIEGSVEQEEWKKVVRDAVREEHNVPEKTKTLKAKILALFEEIKKKGTPEVRAKVEAEIAAKGDAAIDRAIKSLIESKVEADIEAAIERYNAKLEKLKEFTDSMLESGNIFEETIDKAMNILNKKIEKIAMNTETANLVSENKDTILTKFQDISSDLTTELDDLKKSAETFLAKD